MKKKIVMALLVSSLTVMTPAACFAAEDTGAKTEEAAEEKTELKTVGEEKEGCITFKLSNSTEKKITGLAIKSAEEEEFPENMMAEEDSFEIDEKKKIFFLEESKEETSEEDGSTEDQAEKEQADSQESEDAKEPEKYDLHITFEDESTADVHDIALKDLKTLVIREKEGIVYATYRSLSTKEKVNTYDQEKALADEAAAKVAAEQAAAQQAASSNTVQQAPSYDYTYDYESESDYTYDYSNEGDGGTEAPAEIPAETPAETPVDEETGTDPGNENTDSTPAASEDGTAGTETDGGEVPAETPVDAGTDGNEDGGSDGCLDDGLLN